jgi:hypothetical protein
VYWHRPQFVNVGIDQRVFADQVDHTGNPTRVKIDCFHRLSRKDWIAVSACDSQPLFDVTMRLLQC